MISIRSILSKQLLIVRIVDFSPPRYGKAAEFRWKTTNLGALRKNSASSRRQKFYQQVKLFRRNQFFGYEVGLIGAKHQAQRKTFIIVAQPDSQVVLVNIRIARVH